MNKDELKSKSNVHSLTRTSNKNEHLQSGGYVPAAGSRNSEMQFHTADTNQQLRNGNGADTEYKSEGHHHVYQSTNNSFNEQRHLYAEHALNETVVQENEASPLPVNPVQILPPNAVQATDQDLPADTYDYQASISSEEGSIFGESESDSEFKRYIHERTDTSMQLTEGNSFALKEDSIFNATDLELANATEGYLKFHDSRFSKRLRNVERKRSNAEEKINHLETHDLSYRISYKPWKHRLIFDEEMQELPEKEYETFREGTIFKRTHKVTKTPIVGRLKFRSEKIAYSEARHKKDVFKIHRKSDIRRYRLKQNLERVRKMTSGSSFEEDAISKEVRSTTGRAVSGLGWYTRKHYRRIRSELDGYTRLNHQKVRVQALEAQHERLNYKSGIDRQKQKAEEAAKQNFLKEKSKRKIKKEMIQNYKREQGNIFVRNIRQHRLKKTVRKEQRMTRKRTRKLVSSAMALLSIVAFLFLTVALFLSMLLNTASESYVNSTSQNDYYTMTEVTEYFREKEAALEESLKPENLEPILLAENPDIYEFVYILDEISFDANTLVAYLSAKYNEFDLDMVQSDLDEVFEQYYTMKCETKEEDREVPDTATPPDPDTGEYPKIKKVVKICYVTLEKADFFELLQNRIEDAAKQGQMEAFYLTGNGQQIYGPVMYEDWRNKISSNYGWRIHPITGEKIFHEGVDIAIPTGTALYSPVKGTVVVSHYSDSAGHMITIQNSTGWKITFMHMDSRSSQVGDTLEQGQLVGYSGNTGNSTGPHLHLQIQDAEGNSVNPIFLVPFSTVEASETY